MRVERAYLRNCAAANGTRTCIYDCVSSRWTCRYRVTNVHTYTRVEQVVSCDERPLISSSRRLSAVERLRRKTTSRIMANGRLNRPNDRVIFLFLTAEKTIETSNYADREKNIKYKCGLLGCCSSSPSLSLFSLYKALAYRGEIQLSPLYRDSTLCVRVRSLNASHRMIRGNEVHYPNVAAGETGFQRYTGGGFRVIVKQRNNPWRDNPLYSRPRGGKTKAKRVDTT